MALCDLKAETIHELDNGIAGALIDREIAKAVADIDDRGKEDGKPRKVAIELELVWWQDKIVIAVAAQAKLPARRTNSTITGMHVNGDSLSLMFQDGNASNDEQPTFPELDKDGDK